MTRRGWILFASMCVIWGVPYLLIRVAVRDLSPATLVLARTGIAALLLLPIAAARSELRPLLRHWAPLLAFAAIEIAIPWVLLGAAEQHISSSLTGLLIAAVPLVGALIARTTGERERLGFQSALGLLLGLVGVAAIVGLNLEGAGGVPLAEIALVAICYAVGPVILQRYLAGLPALGVIAAALGATAVAYVPIAAFSLPDRVPSATVIGSVAGLAVVCTAVAFLLFFALIAEIGPVRATVITYVNPAVAAVLGVAILGEHFTAGMGVGFALVLAGSVLATRRTSGAATAHAGVLDPASESA
jgi:drug/metabolite transporter (DMT)-like permease